MLFGLFCKLLFSLTLLAQPAKERAAVCIACHGEDGIGKAPLWPNLNGQKKEYMIAQIKLFRSDERKNDLMSPISKTLSDEDIEVLAEYYSNLK